MQLLTELNPPQTDLLQQLAIDCIKQRDSLVLCGQTCLLVKQYPAMVSAELVQQVVKLTDLNQLQNDFDDDGLEEVSFFAL